MTYTKDQIRALLAGATPGPWLNGYDPSHYGAPEVTDGKTFAYYVPDANNAALIAAAPSIIEQLLAETERLESQLAASEAARVALTEEVTLLGQYKADQSREIERDTAERIATWLDWIDDCIIEGEFTYLVNLNDDERPTLGECVRRGEWRNRPTTEGSGDE